MEDLKSIVRNGYGMELDDVSKKHLDEVLKRTIVKNVPFYKQQYVFRLIKMHQTDFVAWNTETVKWLY